VTPLDSAHTAEKYYTISYMHAQHSGTMGKNSSNVRSCLIISPPFLLLSLVIYQVYQVHQVTYNRGQLAFLQEHYYLSGGQQQQDVANERTGGYHYSPFPLGNAVPLPSIRLEKQDNETESARQDLYGGKGDNLHLGGFTKIDHMGLSPTVWRFMIEIMGVRSVLDVGCGRGISTSWFVMHGLANTTLCVEGSHDAYEKSILPSKQTQMVEHDFSRGPWWPSKTFDAVWCVEFLEHVGMNFQFNYIQAFRKAGVIFASHSIWGGWHHVEVHDDDWWILKFEMLGFRYNEKLTEEIRHLAKHDKRIETDLFDGAPKTYNSQHVWLNMLVFINPAVTSLPQHSHLLVDHGCYNTSEDVEGVGRVIVNRKCGTEKTQLEESIPPPEFEPYRIDNPEKRHNDWEKWVKDHL